MLYSARFLPGFFNWWGLASLRWVDCSSSPVEHFLGLVSLSACDAASIFAALKAYLADSYIDAGKLRGQGYDGAATFSGTKNRVRMRIRTLAPRALFVGHMLFSFAAFQLLDVCQVSIKSLQH